MISVVILTKNSEASLKQTLDSCVSFDEILILDTGSTDKTIEIAKKYKNVKIHYCDFNGFGHLRNHGAFLAKNDWILALDSDEVLSGNLIKEIKKTKLKDRNIYRFYFHNFFNDKFIKCCGWYPETHNRLYNKNTTSFSISFVHEKLLHNSSKIIKFKYPILHFSYRNIDDFLKKMSLYSTLFAKQNQFKKKSSLTKAIFHGLFAFFKSYIIKRGFLCKQEGFIISIYNANTAFYKYIKLQEFNSKKSCS